MKGSKNKNIKLVKNEQISFNKKYPLFYYVFIALSQLLYHIGVSFIFTVTGNWRDVISGGKGNTKKKSYPANRPDVHLLRLERDFSRIVLFSKKFFYRGFERSESISKNINAVLKILFVVK